MSEKFEQWAIVELMGHQRIAGRVSEQVIGGCSLMRVDVPACEAVGSHPAMQAFTKLLGAAAIYAVTFTDEAAARTVARQIRVQPIDTWSLKQALQDLPANGGAISAPQLDLDDDDPPY